MTTFNSKETYLQYRTIWKQRYAALSQLIRDLKFCRKSTTTIAAMGKAATERYERTKKEHQTQFGFSPQGLAAHYRKMATAQIEELHAAKEEAQRQYLAKKAQLVTNG
jgi:hypothetical protein